MINGVYIIVEGQTEVEFVKQILVPYFVQQNIFNIHPITLTTSPGHKGGAISYDRYKTNAQILLKQHPNALVTSLIDYYKLDKRFPFYQKSLNTFDKYNRIKEIEKAITDDISNPMFVPYIQLHELEGLLFSDIKGFNFIREILNATSKELDHLNRIIEAHPNPELLNDGEATAPSKRILKLLPRYKKKLHGIMVAEEISLSRIRQKCLRFDSWISNIVEIVNNS